MKLGMPILYEFSSLEENFALANELNLDFVELNLNFGYCRKEMEEGNVKALLDKYHLEATCHFYDEADLGTYDEVVNAYLVLLKKYANLGKGYLKKMNFHNNGGPVVTISGVKNYIYAKEYDVYLPKLLNNFNEAKKICDDNDIEMVIENVDTARGASFLMNNFVEFNKAGFHLNYDIGHDNVLDDEYLKTIEKFSLKFSEFHFHDGNRKTCHLALGTGSIDLKKYKSMAEDNDAYVLLEVKSSEDLKSSIPYFKSL